MPSTWPIRSLLRDSTGRHRAWTIALALAGAMLAASIVAFGYVYAAYEHRMVRDAARTPVFVESAPNQQETGATPPGTVAWWHWRTESLHDLRYVDVFTFGVVDPAAPPPPGLDHWPAPGQVYASQALMDAPGAGPFTARFGDVDGIIDAASLADPGERILYVGASAADMEKERSYPISGFGAELPDEAIGRFGSATYQKPVSAFWAGIAEYLLAPSLVFAFVAARLDAERRERRLGLLQALGADPRRVGLAMVREVAPPAAVGSAVAVALAWGLLARDWWVAPLHVWVLGGDLRSAVWALPLALIIGTAVPTGVALVTFRLRKRRWLGNRPEPTPSEPSRRPVWLLLATIIATNALYQFLLKTNPDMGSKALMLGAFVSIVLIGPCGAWVAYRWSSALGRWGRYSGSPSAIVAGRELRLLARPVARASVAVGATIIIVLQVAVWMSVADAFYKTAREQFTANNGLTLEVFTAPPTAQVAAQIRAELPDSVATLYLPVAGADGRPYVVGTCADLIATLGTCTGGPVPTSAKVPQTQLTVTPDFSVRVSDDPDADAANRTGRMLLVSTDGRPLPRDLITSVLNRHVQPQLGVLEPGEGTLVGTLVTADQGRWYGLGGIIGVVLMGVTAAFALGFEVARLAERFGALALFVGRRRVFLSLGMWLAGLPLLVVTMLGALVGLAVSIGPALPGRGGSMPISTLMWVAVVSILLSGVLSLAAARSIRSAGGGWRSGRG